MKSKFRLAAALLAALSVVSISGCAISAALEEESGFKYNSSQVSSERLSDVTLHDMPDAPSVFGGIAAPSIFSDYTEKPYGIVEGDIYVSVSGNDETGDGTKANPYATIEKAQSAVRELKASGKLPSGTFTVSIMAGEYRISQGFKFTEEDSGTEDCQIIYAAYGDGEVIFKGTTKLDASDFTAVGDDVKAILPDESKDKVVMVNLTKYGITKEQLHIYAIGSYSWVSDYDPSYKGINVELYYDREQLEIARWPNSDSWLETLSIVDCGDSSDRSPGIFKMRLDASERAKTWHSYDDVWVLGQFFGDWGTISSKVSIDFETDNVTYLINHFGNGTGTEPSRQSLYIFYNVLDELDVPGEYYIDRENCILYMYPKDDMENAELELSVAFNDVMLSGDGISYLTFKGLNFMGSKNRGIVFYNSDHITVELCKIYGVGGNDCAVEIGGDYNRILSCEIHYVAAGGICIYGGDLETLTPSNSSVENCYVTHWGMVASTDALAFDIGGTESALRHCEAAYSTAKVLGLGGHGVICEYNIFHDATTLPSDAGALYGSGSLFKYSNCQIRYNMFYNLGSDHGKTAAMYWDYGHSGQRAYGNLIVNITGHGVTTGGGRNNDFINNIVVNSGANSDRNGINFNDAVVKQYREGRSDSLIGSGYFWGVYTSTPKNQLWYDAIAYLQFAIDDESDPYAAHFIYNPMMNHISNNIVIAKNGKLGEVYTWNKTYGTVQDNYTSTLSIDSLKKVFVDPANGDYRIKEDSAIFDSMRDFKDIPYHLIGRY